MVNDELQACFMSDETYAPNVRPLSGAVPHTPE